MCTCKNALQDLQRIEVHILGPKKKHRKNPQEHGSINVLFSVIALQETRL
jgi:hypothetical protein